MDSGGGQERVLVHAQRPDPADPAGVVDQRPAMQHHRGPGGVPSDAVLVRHRSHRPAQLAHLAAHFEAGPNGQHLPRRDTVDGFGPGLANAAWLAATPPTLRQHQPGRPAETVSVPELNLDAVLGLGSPATRRAERLGPDRLDPHHDLADALFDLEDPQAGQSQHLLRQPDTVAHRQGPPALTAVEQPQR